jgi:hypothetical protein
MQFNFFDVGGGSRKCVVAISPRPIFVGGESAEAALDAARGLIWLSDQLPKTERRKKLFHELRHFWRLIRGIVDGDEADAIDYSELTDAIWEQFAAQGGDETLAALKPDPEAQIGRPVSRQMATVINCGDCQAPIAIGSVANDPAIWDEDSSTWVLDRGAWCENCDHVTAWREIATAKGAPTGMLVAYPPPRVLAGDEAATWYAAHQRVARVLVS